MIAVDRVNFGLHGSLPMRISMYLLKGKLLGLHFMDRIRIIKLEVSCKILEMAWEMFDAVGPSRVLNFWKW